jgi:hypothetical protein
MSERTTANRRKSAKAGHRRRIKRINQVKEEMFKAIRDKEFIVIKKSELSTASVDSMTHRISRAIQEVDNAGHGVLALDAGMQLEALTAELAALRQRLAEVEGERAYAHSMGLRFGIMKTSDKPEGQLQHYWEEWSDHERMFREWTEATGAVAQLEREKQRAEAAEAKLGKVRECLAIDSPWPLEQCVLTLISATDILLDLHNYDGHGHEVITAARTQAAKLYDPLKQLTAILNPETTK